MKFVKRHVQSSSVHCQASLHLLSTPLVFLRSPPKYSLLHCSVSAHSLPASHLCSFTAARYPLLLLPSRTKQTAVITVMESQSNRRSLSDASDGGMQHQRTATGEIPSTLCTTSYSGLPVEHFTLGEPYNYAIHEALPAIPSTHPKFQEGEKLIVDVVDKVTQLVPPGEIRDGELASLITELQGMRDIDYGQPLKIGVVGDTGSGKSSFINALLGQPALATEGDSGSSCTQIVTEYIDAGANHMGFQAEIKFKDRKSIDRDIRKHFLAYLKCRPRRKGRRGRATPAADEEYEEFLGIVEEASEDEDFDTGDEAVPDESDGENDDADDEDYEDEPDDEEGSADTEDDEGKASKREHFKTAQEFLMQLLSTDLGFEDEEGLEKMMLPLSPETCQNTIVNLQKQVHKRMRKMLVSQSGNLLVERMDLGSLTAATRPFTESQPAGVEAFWPIVESVRISLGSPLLRQGMAVGDCPGLSDTNLARRQNTQKYLQGCSIILVMGAIDRILDSPSVERYLTYYVPQVGVANVILIPTKCDAAKHNPTGRGVTQAEVDVLKKLEEVFNIAKQKWRTEIGVSRNQKATLRQQMKDAERVLLQGRIRLRNKAVIQEARRQYRDQRGRCRQQLTVIPISSEIHGQYVSGETEDSTPILSICEDGIASVRSALCTVTRKKRVPAAQHHLESVLRRAINRLQLALDVSLNERIAVVFDVIELHHDKSTETALSHRIEMSKVLREIILPPLKELLMDPRGDVVIGLRSRVEDWKKIYYSGKTMPAFERKFGVHRPSYRNEVSDLNQEIVALFKQTLADLVQELSPALETHKVEVLEEGLGVIEELRTALSTNDDLQSFDMQTFWKNFDITEAEFHSNSAAFFDKFVHAVHQATMRVVSADTGTAFNRGVRASFRSALSAPVTGKGITLQRYNHLYDALRGQRTPGPFDAMLTELSDDLIKLMTEQHRELIAMMQAPFVSIRQDLELKFGKRGALTFVDHALRAELKAGFSQVAGGVWNMLAQARACLDMAVWSTNQVEEPTIPQMKEQQAPEIAREGERQQQVAREVATTGVTEALEVVVIKHEPVE
ncbi:hypothetical protein K461DRAFT_303559 [Myriangium duriaei CBS 260.36]|uniref:Dynamin N-terminal domain-containing protein n=1 Tax=Myriangium duriaei CBS 260.36 TaxID=1168546 RepID=A0A9P4MNF6_9PEZI|nr:hypothetical protein K461DRAFT_303559 [Myriangium duriaei CBS 260.36]